MKHIYTLVNSLKPTRTQKRTHTQTRKWAHTRTLTQTHTYALTHTYAHWNPHVRNHTHVCSLKPTRKHTYRHTLAQTLMIKVKKHTHLSTCTYIRPLALVKKYTQTHTLAHTCGHACTDRLPRTHLRIICINMYTCTYMHLQKDAQMKRTQESMHKHICTNTQIKQHKCRDSYILFHTHTSMLADPH